MGDSTNLPWEGLLSLVDLTGDAACLVDADGWRVVYANPPMLQLVDPAGATAMGRSIFELVADLETPALRSLLASLGALALVGVLSWDIIHRGDETRHLVLKAAHPSPFSADKGFFGCKHFSKANAWLMSKGIDPIDWALS